MQREQKGRLGTWRRGCQQGSEGQGGRDGRNVRARETESSIGLVGTLDPVRVLSAGRRGQLVNTGSPGPSPGQGPLWNEYLDTDTPSSPLFTLAPPSSLSGALAPPPSAARPRPRLRGGLRSRPAPPPLLGLARPHSPEPPGQRAPRPRPARPGQARVPRPGPPPRAMESRPPGSRRVSHPAPPLSLAPAAAAAPPHPIPARPWRAGYLSFRLVLGLSGPSPITGAVPTNLWIPAGNPRLLPPYWIPPPLLLRSLESPRYSDFHQVLHVPSNYHAA